MFGRAMVLADKTLFVAGPPDLLDEEHAFGNPDDREAKKKIDEQLKSLDGKKGGILVAISADNGKKLSEYKLDSPPVFDGLIATNGKLYVATVNDEIICLK